jgi:hypothetical protein
MEQRMLLCVAHEDWEVYKNNWTHRMFFTEQVALLMTMEEL